jgi:hypothetical protein
MYPPICAYAARSTRGGGINEPQSGLLLTQDAVTLNQTGREQAAQPRTAPTQTVGQGLRRNASDSALGRPAPNQVQVGMQQSISEGEAQQIGPAPHPSTPNQGFLISGSPIQVAAGESEQRQDLVPAILNQRRGMNNDVLIHAPIIYPSMRYVKTLS